MDRQNALFLCPIYSFLYLLMLLYKDVFVNVFFKVVASTDNSPDNQNKMMPSSDKEVKKKKNSFYLFCEPFHDAFTCGLPAERVFLSFSLCWVLTATKEGMPSTRLLPGQLQANLILCKNCWYCTCYAVFCTHCVVLTQKIFTWRTNWLKKSTDTKNLMSTRWYILTGIAQSLTSSPFEKRTRAYNRPWTTEVSISGSANYSGLVVSGWAAVCRDWLRVMPCPVSPSALSQMQLRNSGPT